MHALFRGSGDCCEGESHDCQGEDDVDAVQNEELGTRKPILAVHVAQAQKVDPDENERQNIHNAVVGSAGLRADLLVGFEDAVSDE